MIWLSAFTHSVEANRPDPVGLSISIIIPALNEAPSINDVLSRLYREAGNQSFEIVVVDGDGQGGTLARIDDPRVFKILSPSGRSLQMNAGAAIASGDILLFLHADTILPANGLAFIRQRMREPDWIGGAFDLGIDSNRLSLRLIEWVGALRSRMTRIPYGDQAIFIRKEAFRTLGGFSEIPLMEDVDLMRRIKRRKWPIVILPQKIRTSSRRWECEGVLYGTLRNWTLLALYMMGVSPARLARYYRRRA